MMGERMVELVERKKRACKYTADQVERNSRQKGKAKKGEKI